MVVVAREVDSLPMVLAPCAAAPLKAHYNAVYFSSKSIAFYNSSPCEGVGDVFGEIPPML